MFTPEVKFLLYELALVLGGLALLYVVAVLAYGLYVVIRGSSYMDDRYDF